MRTNTSPRTRWRGLGMFCIGPETAVRAARVPFGTDLLTEGATMTLCPVVTYAGVRTII
jgi:hypothetical protein